MPNMARNTGFYRFLRLIVPLGCAAVHFHHTFTRWMSRKRLFTQNFECNESKSATLRPFLVAVRCRFRCVFVQSDATELKALSFHYKRFIRVNAEICDAMQKPQKSDSKFVGSNSMGVRFPLPAPRHRSQDSEIKGFIAWNLRCICQAGGRELRR